MKMFEHFLRVPFSCFFADNCTTQFLDWSFWIFQEGAYCFIIIFAQFSMDYFMGSLGFPDNCTIFFRSKGWNDSSFLMKRCLHDRHRWNQPGAWVCAISRPRQPFVLRSTDLENPTGQGPCKVPKEKTDRPNIENLGRKLVLWNTAYTCHVIHVGTCKEYPHSVGIVNHAMFWWNLILCGPT